MLAQRAKVDWIRMGDGNDRFFNATIKDKAKQTCIHHLQRDDGVAVSIQHEIKGKILRFYDNLVGTKASNLLGIDTEAMRRGKQLSREHSDLLEADIITQRSIKD